MKNNIQNCVHIENDVMVYWNLNQLEDKFKKINKLLIPMDHKHRCIPSFIFIPNHHHLKPVIDNYDYQKNDMENLAIAYHKFDNIDTLPLLNNEDKQKGFLREVTKKFTTFECIFDAAAIGQYLGGTSSDVNKIGFINEKCIIDYSKYLFIWKNIGNLYRPYIIKNNREIPILNLHIHCKQLQNFLANSPKENKLIQS